MNYTWNVPLHVVYVVKELSKDFLTSSSLTIDYENTLKVLGANNIEDTERNRVLLELLLYRLKDNKTDYHIMNLEGLFLRCNDEEVDLTSKMAYIKENVDMESYRSLYNSDINKMKQLLLEMVKHVSVMQVDEFILFKYTSEVTYLDLWNEFYMESRGVIIDFKQIRLVATPYRKFFNYKEKSCTSEDRVGKLLQLANKVSIRNKEDGSMGSVSKYDERLFVSTPGSMQSEQAVWAKSYLTRKHKSFIADIKEGKTYLFEIIYPENRIVVDYEGQEILILTGIRDNRDGSYYSENELVAVASKYGFAIPLSEEKEFYELIRDSSSKTIYPADKKEGWVISIQTEHDNLMFKVKCDDYCEIHNVLRLANSPKIVFKHIKEETYDDFFSKLPDMVRPVAERITEKIMWVLQEFKQEADSYLREIPEDIHFNLDELRRMNELKRLVNVEIHPAINDKLSKNVRKELSEFLLAKAFGKEPHVERYYISEFNKLWDMIPDELRDLKETKKKEGKLLGFINRRVPQKFVPVILNQIRGERVDYFSHIDIKEIEFDLRDADLIE